MWEGVHHIVRGVSIVRSKWWRVMWLVVPKMLVWLLKWFYFYVNVYPSHDCDALLPLRCLCYPHLTFLCQKKLGRLPSGITQTHPLSLSLPLIFCYMYIYALTRDGDHLTTHDHITHHPTNLSTTRCFWNKKS